MSESTHFRVGESTPDAPLTADEVFAAPSAEDRADVRVSALEGLRAALAPTAEKLPEPVVLRVPNRPGVTLVFMPTIEDEQRKAWEKRSKKKNRRVAGGEEVDEMLFASLVLANTCVEVRFEGEPACDEEGTPLSFRHRMLWEMVGAGDPATAIKNLFASDPHVLVASNDVLMAAGYDDDLSADPTGA